jgi:RNA polymerase sigma-70 factor (ECF subfamily)
MVTAVQLDHALVRRVQQGDKTAFDTLVRKYQSKVFQLIRRYIKDPDETLDVSQEAFIKAYRALPKFRGESAFYTWMYRIAINTAKNHLAMRGRHSADEDIEIEDAEQFEAADRLKEHDTPEELAMSDELIQAIQRGFDKLPEELRTALTLREFHDYSYDKIAQIMACPVGTVRSRIFRARSALDKELAYVYD